MSDCRGTTSPTSGNGGAPPSAVQTCPYAQGSEILIVDELGIPLVSTSVTLRPSGGSALSATTDLNGKVCLSLPPGTSVQVEIGNVHEAGPGDSTTTSSGRHFSTGGTGP